jgi:antitoxin (DNA-binding transcriptional repressor) of toxin-antitoxin stability system
MDDTYRFEADKTLLEHIEKGDAVEITRQGAVVARVVRTAPMPAKAGSPEAIAAAERILNGPKINLDGLTIKELINEGRKY